MKNYLIPIAIAAMLVLPSVSQAKEKPPLKYITMRYDHSIPNVTYFWVRNSHPSKKIGVRVNLYIPGKGNLKPEFSITPGGEKLAGTDVGGGGMQGRILAAWWD